MPASNDREVLRPFFEWVAKQPAREKSKLIKYLGTFCQVKQIKTVENWVNGQYTPNGTHLLKVTVFADLLKFELPWLLQLKNRPVLFRLIQVIAFDLVTADAISKTLQYASRDHLFRVLRGHCGVSSSRLKQVQKILQENNFPAEVDRAIEIFSNQLPLTTGKAEPLPIKPSSIASDVNVTLTVLSIHLRSVQPLLELVASDGFSAEDRATLRRMVDIFGIANLCGQLCGEDARNIERARNQRRFKTKGEN